jgi:hypothetical protein
MYCTVLLAPHVDDPPGLIVTTQMVICPASRARRPHPLCNAAPSMRSCRSIAERVVQLQLMIIRKDGRLLNAHSER